MSEYQTTSDGVIRSAEGFEVTMLGRAGYRYVDTYGEYFVDGELLMGNPDAVVLQESVVRVRDGVRSPESAKRRKIIAGRVRLALESQGMSVVIG